MPDTINFVKEQAVELTPLSINEPGVERDRSSSDKKLLSIYNRVKLLPPELNANGTQIILPATGDENYGISLYGSSNQAVIQLNGCVTQPLEDMEVYLFYKVFNKQTGESLHMDDPVLVRIKGRYDEACKSYHRPDIIPAVREWKGNEGTFRFNGRIVLADGDTYEAAEVIRDYLEGFCNFTVNICTGTPESGDIRVLYDKTLTVGEEGYVMTIDDILTITAPTYVGLVYAGATVAQMLHVYGRSIPKGIMRDYPQYKVRSVMIDDGHMFIPLDYLKEITKYAAFFKLSELHVHINDKSGEQLHSFRIESKKFPAINSGVPQEGLYSQEDYRKYQKEVKKYGIDVITEIDSPAHIRCVGAYDASLMLNESMIDIENPAAVEFIKRLYDEFLDGDDPVFQSGKFHIGVDEYDWHKAEQVREYINEMSAYVIQKGLTPVVWCSLNDTKPTGEYQGYGGNTPVTNAVIEEYYSKNTAKLQILLENECPIISAEARSLYIVPILNTEFYDYLDMKKLYSEWEVGNITPDDNPMKPGHPLLLGAEACLWYKNVGCSEFDIFDRLKDQIMLMSEKNWFGENKSSSVYDDFLNRMKTLAEFSPLANPGRYIRSQSDEIVNLNCADAEAGIIQDQSGNGYDAIITGLSVNQRLHALELDGSGFISLPFISVGYPYRAEFTLRITGDIPENAVFAESRDGAILFNVDNTGKIGLFRKGYILLFDYILPLDRMTSFGIACHDASTYLYVDGYMVAKAEYYRLTPMIQKTECCSSPTFVLPVEKFAAGITGYLQLLRIWKENGEP